MKFTPAAVSWSCLTALLLTLHSLQAVAAAKRPNILWITAEDISPHLGCYGDPHAITPRLDRLAAEGVRYTHAFTTAGVCAPCRSGIITGMYQTTIGTHHMRCRAKLPAAVRPFPAYLRDAGYYAANNAKEDYQFITPDDVWDDSSPTAHWRNRPDQHQPFFAVFNFGGCHESGIARDEKYRAVTEKLTPRERQDPAQLTTLPAYYADVPAIREDWKRNYELITAMDAWAGNILDQLQADGLADETIVMFWSDHGIGLPRAKRWLYDSGTHIPLIVRIPPSLRGDAQGAPGTATSRLVSSIDFGATVLNLAGIERPRAMQGRAFLGTDLPPEREYVFGARDRMDERYDLIRMVRDRRFKYLRNYEPLKTYYQVMETPEKGAAMRALRRLHAQGALPPAAAQFFAARKPVEELYDVANDPHEIHNLVDDPQFAGELARLRGEHLAWTARTRDLGFIAEPILVDRERALGSRYAILRQEGGAQLARRIIRSAVAASAGGSAASELVGALDDDDPAVRYWGAVGLGNIGPAARARSSQLRRALNDPCAAVRVAAARALCRMGEPEAALPVLVAVLQNGAQWERLQAAIVLDEIDDQARPVLASMHEALIPRQDLFARGKYTVRVLNWAIQELR